MPRNRAGYIPPLHRLLETVCRGGIYAALPLQRENAALLLSIVISSFVGPPRALESFQ